MLAHNAPLRQHIAFIPLFQDSPFIINNHRLVHTPITMSFFSACNGYKYVHLSLHRHMQIWQFHKNAS